MYKYERYNFRVLTLLLVIVTIIFFSYQKYIEGTASIVLGILLSISFQGVKIDTAGGRYIKYDRFAFLRIGRWEELPPPSYVTIVRINLSSNRTQALPMVIPEDKKGVKAFKVNLVVEDDVRYITICRGSLEEMKEEALKLGRVMGIRVLDYSTHEKHWIL